MNGDTNRRLIGDVGGLEDGWASVKALPPLPTPKHWERRSEACCGFAVVAGTHCVLLRACETRERPRAALGRGLGGDLQRLLGREWHELTSGRVHTDECAHGASRHRTAPQTSADKRVPAFSSARLPPPPPLHPGITFICVSVTHMTVWTVDERSTVGSRICLLLVYLEAAVAALCFGGLMCVIPIH